LKSEVARLRGGDRGAEQRVGADAKAPARSLHRSRLAAAPARRWTRRQRTPRGSNAAAAGRRPIARRARRPDPSLRRSHRRRCGGDRAARLRRRARPVQGGQLSAAIASFNAFVKNYAKSPLAPSATTGSATRSSR
jgi:TolA-binding protein